MTPCQPLPTRTARTARVLSALAATVTLSVAAAAIAAGPGVGADRGPAFPISIADAKARAQARFEALDTDHNGEISPAELAAAPEHQWMPRHGRLHGHGMTPQGARPTPTPEQREAWREKHQQAQAAMDEALFEHLDSNGDGQLSKAEFTPDKLRAAKREVFRAQLFARLDKDGSGGLSRDELPDMTRRLEAMDANHDGTVTREEARAYHRSLHQGASDDAG